MKPPPFRYAVARSLDEALHLKSEYGSEASFLAGGQSLMPVLNVRLAQPQVIIDLNEIADLSDVRPVPDDGLRFGAMTRYRILERSPLVAAHQPLVAEALPFIAHPQIRNRGTIGGNLAHADPASELPAIMVALRAVFRVSSAGGPDRAVPAADFFKGPLTTDLRPEEMLTAIEVPSVPRGSGTCFMEVSRRRGDFALIGVAALVCLDDAGICRDARLSFCGAGDTPVCAQSAADILVGQSVTGDAIAAVVREARQLLDPPGSIHASKGFQRHLAGVLTERALQEARSRAGSGRSA